MTYVKQVWTDTVTPVDKAHMDHIEDGIVAAVPADVVAAAATRVVASFLAAPDTQPAFKITGDGKIQWGPGGSTALDTSLYRNAASTLKTDGWLHAGFGIFANAGTANTLAIGYNNSAGAIGPAISFGNAGDTVLYRSAASTLKTDGHLQVAQSATVGLGAALGTVGIYAMASGDTNARVGVMNSGVINFGPGNAGFDVVLGRAAADLLYTDDSFRVYGNSGSDRYWQFNDTVLARAGSTLTTTKAVAIGEVGSGSAAGLLLGTDTNLYRGGSGTLKTDGSFSVVGQINLGSAGDANLLRYAANKVSSIGSFVSDGALTGWGFETHATGDAASRALLRNDAALLFGGGTTTYDTNLYRSAAGVLKTDGSLQVVGSIALDWDGANYFLQTTGHNRLVFGGDVNANLYRSAASTLKTDGSLQVLGSIQINGGTSVLAQGGALSLDYDGTNYFLSTTGHNRLVFSGDAVANLYRSAAGVLKTDGSFIVGSQLTVVGTSLLGGTLSFGNGDTNLYRSATNTLKTDGNLIVGGKITGADWTLICTQILGGTQANFDTNTLLGGNIPSTFTHLMIVIQANSTVAFDNLYLRVNNDGGANYDAQWLSVSGTAVSGAQDIAADHIHICAMPSVITAGPFASAKILISNYKGTAFWKSIQSEANRKDTSGAGNANLGLRAGTWLSTAAVTRLTLYPASGSFAAGSVFSLYGLS